MKNYNNQVLSINVLYFSSLAQKAGKDSETVQTTSGDLVTLYAKLSAKYDFDLPQDKVAIAINHEFGDWDDAILSGDTVAFIPPVAGG